MPSDRPVVWTARARRELEAVRAYISAVNPIAAQRFTARLVAAAESLSVLPYRARGGAGARELVVIRPYVIRYQVRPQAVVILGVRHGARLRRR
jgi:plasmid stabilization system protein ParE